jgi:LmbE family N-acetylglucosaminyl deacetylase
MKILAIGAHPDDIEFGCGGTLLKWIHAGHDVYLFVMTQGDKGGNPSLRKKEQNKSAGIMEVRDLFWGSYKDTQLTPNMNKMVTDIEILLKKIKPDFTFINYREDTHQDHRALSKAAVSATRYIRNVIYYEVPTTQNFSPTLFVDITTTLKEKISTLLAHNSQALKTNIQGLSIMDAAHSTAVFRGVQARTHFAEGFMPLRLFINV